MRIGDVLMVGLPGPDLGPSEAAFLERIRPAGLILFARNLDTPRSLVALRQAIDRLPHPPRLVAIDQEGGRVGRLASWTGPTRPAASWAQRTPREVREYGAATGRALTALGFNLDFAPVVDLSPADAPNGVGDRAFGTDPQQVVRYAGAFLEGLQANGVAGCLKHFPGLGATVVDSHDRLPVDPRDRGALETDLLPFRRLAPRADSVMVGHAHYPGLDDEPDRPASLSPPIVRGLLRDRLAYDGLVATDDLEMGAVSSRDHDGAVAVDAIRAGCDLLLYCGDPARAERAVSRLERQAATDQRFVCALTRAAGSTRRAAARRPMPRADERAWSLALAPLVDCAGIA